LWVALSVKVENPNSIRSGGEERGGKAKSNAPGKLELARNRLEKKKERKGKKKVKHPNLNNAQREKGKRKFGKR